MPSRSVPPADGKGFTIYDNTGYADIDVGHLLGIDKINLIYAEPAWLESFTRSQLPPRAELVERIRAATNPGPIVLDFETIYLRGDSEPFADHANIAHARSIIWITLLRWIRQATDKPIGAWGFGQHTWSIFRDLARGPADAMDLWFVDGYTDGDLDESAWQDGLAAAIAATRAIDDAKPILVYLWPNFHGGARGGEFIPGPVWRRQLDWVRTRADGIVLWSSSTTPVVGDNTDWLDQTAAFLDSRQPEAHAR